MGAEVDASCALHAVKIGVRIFGGITCISFAVLTCRMWAEPRVEDFWEFCHWIGQTMLGVFIGLGGCYAEVKGSMSSVTRHFKKFALNRIGLSIFYFWLGCYVMGGEIVGKGVWTTIAHVTGVVSWVTAAGDLFVSCCAERLGDEGDENEEAELSPSRKDAENPAPSKPMSFGRSAEVETPSSGWATGATPAAMPAAMSSVPAATAAAAAAAAAPEPVAAAAPESGWATGGGWNSTASKPFGQC